MKKTLFALALALLLIAGPLRAGSSRPIKALPAGGAVVATDLVEISRSELGGDRWKPYSVTASAIQTLTNVKTGQQYQIGASAKAGTTAGWVVAVGANLYEWTLPASQTASTLVIPVDGLKVGWTITAFGVNCQIESAGGAVTLDANLRSLTNVAADPTDASVGSITQVSVTADTASEPQKTGLTDVVETDERFYILVTGTTAASTDVRCLNANITVTET